MRLPQSDRERNYLTRGVVYALADRLTAEEKSGFGMPDHGLHVGAFYSGEYRPVRPNEWYLSGAEVAAYRAPNGTTDSYHIAHLVSYREHKTFAVILE